MGSQYRIMTLFADGGFMMYPLVLCSLIALGVIIAKTWTLWVAHRGTGRVIREVEEAARAGDLDEALAIASATPGPAAAILTAGLRRIQNRTLAKGELESAISTTGTIELAFLERGLVVLATVANVAPLMGFLGTVAGMILAFGAIEAAGDVDPTLVAGGIKVALITTAAGLVIAVPVNIAYNFFVSRIDTLIVDMERGTQNILNLAWDLEKEGKIRTVARPAATVGAGATASRRPAVSAPEGVAGDRHRTTTDRPAAEPGKPSTRGDAPGGS